ncbi:MAG: metallophosphoesterase [Myxococcota bacterium]|nr:metallophosphoesterase [Myxococcota bacterium]
MRILVLLSLIAAPALAQTPFGADSSPTSWRQLSEKYRYKCPGPFTTMKEKDTIKVVGLEIERNGSSWSVNGETKTVGKLKIGVLSAIKDAGRDTKKNLAAFANWFKQNKVDLVVANGDIALDEFDLEEVFFELGKLGLPVLVFAGNSESRTSFNRTATEVARKVPQLINGNWVRELRWGKYSLWTLPGYHDKKFLYGRNGCLYTRKDIRSLGKEIGKNRKQVNVLLAHGPPRYSGKVKLDVITDGKHVGDKWMTKLIKDYSIKWGIFGHILEAGATLATKMGKTSAKAGSSQKSLYVNAGSANGLPWGMNDGSTLRGMAAIMTLDGKVGTVQLKTIK